MRRVTDQWPAAYLFTCCKPADPKIRIWVIPELILRVAMEGLELNVAHQTFTIEVTVTKQRIKHCHNSPDLAPYYQELAFEAGELLLLADSRKADSLAKSIDRAAKRLKAAGEFDPTDQRDGRRRVLASIARRRGQHAFRTKLLKAYGGRCAVTGCDVKSVLEAAHILPYRGQHTNHPGNGLLLRADLHTLFDLRLITVDVDALTLVLSPALSGSCYAEYQGKGIRLPRNPKSRPSPEALKQHRQKSGL
jgi:hypothetical protein